MTRLHVSLFVLLLLAVALFGQNSVDQPTLAASIPDACLQPTPADTAAIYHAADSYMVARYPSVYGSAEVRRVVGDWALVVVVPKIQADRAALILHRTPQGWNVVAGPGTAFPPGTRPAGLPNELLEPTVPCG